MKVLPFPALKAAKGISYSRVHIDRLEKDGRFPKRVAIGAHRVAWIETEVDAWLEAKAADRGAA